MNRGPRNQSLLRQISEANPFKTVAAAFFDISGGFAKEMEAVGAKQDLSVKGKRDKARDHLRKALRARQDRLKPIAEFHAQTERMKAKVRLPDYDRADDYSARLRAEMRDKSYDMTPLERMGLMSGPDRIAYFDAISEQPLFMSGLREKGELDVYAGLKEARLAELHGPLQAVIAERQSRESEILMVDNTVLNDLAADFSAFCPPGRPDLVRADFDAIAKQIESKAAAEAPKATPQDRTKPTASPEFEEIWKRFDEMVDASVV
jgi:hypothetical protein